MVTIYLLARGDEEEQEEGTAGKLPCSYGESGEALRGSTRLVLFVHDQRAELE